MGDRLCPECQIGRGLFVTGDTDKNNKYIIFICPRPKCLNVWRTKIGEVKSEEST